MTASRAALRMLAAAAALLLPSVLMAQAPPPPPQTVSAIAERIEANYFDPARAGEILTWPVPAT